MLSVKQKLFVLSLDALVREDIEYMMTKPNFRRIMGKRAEVNEVLSVFPAITYPAHTTLMLRGRDLAYLEHEVCMDTGHLWASSKMLDLDFYEEAETFNIYLNGTLCLFGKHNNAYSVQGRTYPLIHATNDNGSNVHNKRRNHLYLLVQ